ncbi:MAG: DUF72 domain-containing protein [Lactobacillus sp.]|jgi:uncharacterized protein YecE (DUF72 family)|nr:DUF72 domain-containing protein [Lactobacillus sp.]
MITIGLTTWSEHQSLLPEKKQLTLVDYAGFFPTVEIDSLFYGLKTPAQVQKWADAVPDGFQFIVKATSAMTQHDKEPLAEAELSQLFKAYRGAIKPLVQAHKLKTILLQFPPFFKLTPANIRYLIQVRQLLPKLPVAIEFRNPTWYDQLYVGEMVALMQRLQFTLVAADEPQTQVNSVPFYPTVTNPKLGLFRLHGRNMAGWLNQDKQWRGKRTLYRYNQQELLQFATAIKTMTQTAAEVCVIFNNNSGGDAADNALALQQLLGIEFHGLGPKQLDLF